MQKYRDIYYTGMHTCPNIQLYMLTYINTYIHTYNHVEANVPLVVVAAGLFVVSLVGPNNIQTETDAIVTPHTTMYTRSIYLCAYMCMHTCPCIHVHTYMPIHAYIPAAQS